MPLGSAPLSKLAADLSSGAATSRELVEEGLAAIAAPDGEGARAFVFCNTDRARAEADASDALRTAGAVPSPLAGLPFRSRTCSTWPAKSRPRPRARLPTRRPQPGIRPSWPGCARPARFVLGRTNLTEFAYFGDRHQPAFRYAENPWDRARGRIPGGSSSGAAVSVTDGMAAAAIGSDTGGSVRIPAALCGVTGLKTTTGRIPLDGVFPLSADARFGGARSRPRWRAAPCSTQRCRAAMCGPRPRRCRFAAHVSGVPTTIVQDGMDEIVGAAFQAALDRLSAAGALVQDIAFPPFAEIAEVNAAGGILGAEAHALHRRRLAAQGNMVDPRVRTRIERGVGISSADLLMSSGPPGGYPGPGGCDRRRPRLLMPTVAVVAPPIDDIAASDELYAEMNPFVLRNTTFGNFLDCCALSIPIHEPGAAPVGLMAVDRTGADAHLIRVGLAVEKVLRRS